MPVLATTIDDDTERLFVQRPVEVCGGGGQMRIGGYASVFNVQSRPLAGFTEVVTPTFFDHSRSNGFADVVCRFNHSDLMVLGATNSGTLRLAVDSVGLDYECDLPPAAPMSGSWFSARTFSIPASRFKSRMRIGTGATAGILSECC